MKYTLLKMVQLILSSMDSDAVNSIGDTEESQQIVDVIETTYNDLISTIDFPEHWDFIELVPSLDPLKPTLMTLPEDVATIEYILYDNSESGATERSTYPVKPLTRGEFFRRMNTLDTADLNVYQYNYTVGAETFDVRGYNNAFPTYYTVIGDRTIIFDNYDVNVESTLTANRTTSYGMRIPVFLREDSFVPDLDARSFSLLFNEAKSQAFLELKQIQNAKADQRARQAKVAGQKKKYRTPQRPNMYNYPSYGRRRQCRGLNGL